jgi:hypothetical protein
MAKMYLGVAYESQGYTSNNLLQGQLRDWSALSIELRAEHQFRTLLALRQYWTICNVM